VGSVARGRSSVDVDLEWEVVMIMLRFEAMRYCELPEYEFDDKLKRIRIRAWIKL